MFLGANVSEKLENNHDFIKDGEAFITAYIRSHYSKMHPEIIVNAIQEYLMSETMLAHIAKHIGLTDLILTNVSIFYGILSDFIIYFRNIQLLKKL